MMQIKQYNTPNNPREYYVVNADGKKIFANAPPFGIAAFLVKRLLGYVSLTGLLKAEQLLRTSNLEPQKVKLLKLTTRPMALCMFGQT